jgi:hypothetical protein
MIVRRRLLALMLALSLAPVAAAAPRPGILVEGFDFYDASIDHRPVVIADQKRWLKDATARLKQEIDMAGRVKVIKSPRQRQFLARISRNYQHPSTCRSCALAAARDLGARYLFIGSIHKISDLICYMRGEVDDARTGTVLLVTSTEVKADNKTMWLRAAQALAAKVDRTLQGMKN